MNITEAPWQVSLRRFGGKSHFCGGSIIGKSWILTAAHCLRPFQSNDILVRVGSTYKDEGGQMFDVKKLYIHQQENILTDYDFGMIELNTELQFNAAIQPIALANSGDAPVADGTRCLVSGWGKTLNWEVPSNILRGSEVPIVNQRACAIAYSPKPITPRMICAGFMEGGEGGMLKR